VSSIRALHRTLTVALTDGKPAQATALSVDPSSGSVAIHAVGRMGEDVRAS
jgi:hypothetical protein